MAILLGCAAAAAGGLAPGDPRGAGGEARGRRLFPARCRYLPGGATTRASRFPTAAVFETVHGHPGVDGSPFADGTLPLPCRRACNARPATAPSARTAGRCCARAPSGNPSSISACGAMPRQTCRITSAWPAMRTTGRARWAGSAHEQGDVACADCHRIHDRVDLVRTQTGQAQRCLDCHRERARRPAETVVASHAGTPARLQGLSTTPTVGPAPAMRWCASRPSTRPALPVTPRSRGRFCGSTRRPARIAASVTCRTGPISRPSWCAGRRTSARPAIRRSGTVACRRSRTGCPATPAAEFLFANALPELPCAGARVQSSVGEPVAAMKRSVCFRWPGSS